MKKVSGVRPIGEGADELRQAENELAEVLRESNIRGLTKAMGLSQRLDYGVFSDIENMRTLVGIVLKDWLSKNDDEEKEDNEVDEKVQTARRLRQAIQVFDECLKKKEDAA